ncbi:MAG: hypothetical protein J6V66_03795 [Clostridia bacterium]|nr:hypothetical protein [Clostridia bacterium]
MVNKLTKRKLKLFAVYDLWKVAVVSVLACAILLLAFNFVAKKPSDGQEFKILIDKTVNMGDDINDLFENLFTKAPEQGGFSYEMLKAETVIINGTDENPDAYLLNSVYGDLYYDDVVILQEDLLEIYVNNHMATDINVYISDAKAFLISNGLCDANGVFNETAVYDYFDRTRKGDSRFRTKEKKEQGRKDELERLKGIWFMANALENCLRANPNLLDKEREYNYYTLPQKGVYALRLGALIGKDGADISNLFNIKHVKEDTEEIYYSADGLYLAIGSNKEENGDLYYEMLSVVYTLIKTYTTYLD